MERNRENLEFFVMNHFLPRARFIYDRWAGYNFLNNNLNYTHEIHNHGARYLSNGLKSTSHIESLWSKLKAKIKGLYLFIPKNNLIYYLKNQNLGL